MEIVSALIDAISVQNVRRFRRLFLSALENHSLTLSPLAPSSPSATKVLFTLPLSLGLPSLGEGVSSDILLEGGVAGASGTAASASFTILKSTEPSSATEIIGNPMISI